MKVLSTAMAVVAVSTWVVTGASAQVNVSSILSNTGFEDGNLNGWTVTRPNTDYVVSLSPPVNPTIDPADPGNNPATLTAAVGLYFTGLQDPDDVAPDLKYKLAHTATSVSYPSGTVFQVKVWANRGRLEPYDTPASTADVLVRIFGWGSGTTPTVTASTDNWSRTITWNPAAQSFNFTGVADGTWAQQTFSFTSTAALSYLSLSLAGRTNNHHQYIALDTGDKAVSTESGTWSSVKELYR